MSLVIQYNDFREVFGNCWTTFRLMSVSEKHVEALLD